MRRTIGGALFAMVVMDCPCLGAETLRLAVGMTYIEARRELSASGWTPTNYATAEYETDGAKDLDNVLRSEFLKRGAPEVGSCFPTGMAQCFGIWRKGDRLLVVESTYEGYDPKIGPDVYFYYQVRLHGLSTKGGTPTRDDWDPRSADMVPGSYPRGHHW